MIPLDRVQQIINTHKTLEEELASANINNATSNVAKTNRGEIKFGKCEWGGNSALGKEGGEV